MQLGDLFPDELKESFAKENLVPGAVIRMHVPDTNPPKIKRFVIVAEHNSDVVLATVFINSEINPNMFRSQELRNLHLPILENGRDYLDKDSFIDCSDIIVREKDVLFDKLKERPSQHIGKLSDSDLNDVLDKLQSAPTIPIRTKRDFNLV
jgi:hypothetical protein